jgi:Fe-S cluster biogenesis protein NfuA
LSGSNNNPVRGALRQAQDEIRPQKSPSGTMEHEQAIAIIKNVLEELRPAIMNHNGNIEFAKYEDAIVYVKLHGACVECPVSMFTLKLGIEEALKAELPEVKEVIAIE